MGQFIELRAEKPIRVAIGKSSLEYVTKFQRERHPTRRILAPDERISFSSPIQGVAFVEVAPDGQSAHITVTPSTQQSDLGPIRRGIIVNEEGMLATTIKDQITVAMPPVKAFFFVEEFNPDHGDSPLLVSSRCIIYESSSARPQDSVESVQRVYPPRRGPLVH